MKDMEIEIIDDTVDTNAVEIKSDNEQSDSLNVSENNIEKTQVIATKIDKKKLKEEKKKLKEEKKRLAKEKKLNKKNKTLPNNEEEKITSNVYENTPVNIVETAITRGASGSQVIGNIEGDNILPTNNELPPQIDVSVKPKIDNRTKTKKIKVISKKEKILSIIISVFVVLVLGGTGFIIYYFGYATNPSIYEAKTIYLELGDNLQSSVSYYITSSKPVDDMEYSLDLSNVAKDIIGSYQYSIKHKNVIKYGQIIVHDTTAPKIIMKDEDSLVFQKDSSITKDDIVLNCEDVTNCSYKLENDISSEFPGEKDVVIIAKDDAGNEAKETVKIKIVDIQKTLVCSSKEIPDEANTYATSFINTLSFDSNDYLVQKSGLKQYRYNDYAAYFAKMNELQSDSKYIFNRMNFTYSEVTNVDLNNLTNLNDIVSYYNEQGYDCK